MCTIFTTVTFTGNTARNGGGMANHAGDHSVLTDVTFDGNSASASGGGLTGQYSDSSTISATGSRGDPLLFTITGGNDAGIFTVDPNTGAITVAGRSQPDYGTTLTYILTVEASDRALADTATIMIHLRDIDEPIGQGGPELLLPFLVRR